jgi:hypothetical protein
MRAPHFWAIGIMLRSRVACNPFIRRFVFISFMLFLFEFNYPAVDSAVLKIPVQVVNSSNKGYGNPTLATNRGPETG